MKRILPGLMLGFLVSLFGCDGRSGTLPEAAPRAERISDEDPPAMDPAAFTLPEGDPRPDLYLIDYAHVSRGALHHGTFSLLGDQVAATWTVDDGTHEETRDLALTEETFRNVWNALGDVPDFEKGAVTDPNQQLDPATHHVVGIIFRVGEQQGMRTHLIPADGASPAFADWLSTIGYAGE